MRPYKIQLIASEHASLEIIQLLSKIFFNVAKKNGIFVL